MEHLEFFVCLYLTGTMYYNGILYVACINNSLCLYTVLQKATWIATIKYDVNNYYDNFFYVTPYSCRS